MRLALYFRWGQIREIALETHAAREARDESLEGLEKNESLRIVSDGAAFGTLAPKIERAKAPPTIDAKKGRLAKEIFCSSALGTVFLGISRILQ